MSEKVQYSSNQAIKNGLNEAILLMSINEALLSRQNFVGSPCLFTRQQALKMGYFYWLRVKFDLILYEGDSNF